MSACCVALSVIPRVLNLLPCLPLEEARRNLPPCWDSSTLVFYWSGSRGDLASSSVHETFPYYPLAFLSFFSS